MHRLKLFVSKKRNDEWYFDDITVDGYFIEFWEMFSTSHPNRLNCFLLGEIFQLIAISANAISQGYSFLIPTVPIVHNDSRSRPPGDAYSPNRHREKTGRIIREHRQHLFFSH